jgi:carbon-monoxide dehydrogenase large subunit
MTTSLFGARVKRREDSRLLRGTGKYVDDIKLAGMLSMQLVRSPYAHAKITSIDASAAEAFDGVVAVYTGEQLKDEQGSVPCGWVVPDTKEVAHPPIAIDTVRFVGDIVAAVVAKSPEAAADAVRLVEVEYETLPVVVGTGEAAKSGAPQLHHDAPNNIAFEWQVAGGDVEAAVKDAEVVVKQTMVNQRLVPNAMETRGIVCEYNHGSNQLTLWTSTQIPHLVRLLLALTIGHPEHLIRVVAPDVGGAFGSKLYLYAEEVIAAVVTKRVRRPVKWIESRQEAYMATTHGRDHLSTGTIAGKRDGTITGLDVETTANMGAYLSTFAPLIPTLLYGLMMGGPYDLANLRCRVTGVYTNTTPVDAYRGAGRPEAVYLIERLVDMFAAEIGMDPGVVRRMNFIEPFSDGHTVATGVAYDSGNYHIAFDRAMEMVGYEDFRKEQAAARDEGRLLGIGISTYVEICGAAPSSVAVTLGARAGLWESATVRVNPTGTIRVFSGSSSHGQGHETSFAQLVAGELGVPMENVEIVQGDTDQVQFGTGTFGSRSAAVGGGAINAAVTKIKDKAKKLAAHLLEAAPEDIVFEDGKLFVKGAPAEAKTFGDIALAAHVYAGELPEGMEPGLEETSFFDPSNFTWPFGTHIAIVEVDPDTGAVTPLRYIAVDDVGNIINPMIVDGMVHGGAAQGLGQALQEEAIYDEDGQLLTGTMMDYAVPSAEDLPNFEVDQTVTPTLVNPMGVKGAGETATIAGSPAIINAVVDALAHLGVKHLDMPAKPENVWRVMRDAQA